MELLKRYRQFRGKSREELAKEVGLNPETVGRYERGNREPNTTTIKKLATALGVTPNDLMGIEKDENKEDEKQNERASDFQE